MLELKADKRDGGKKLGAFRKQGFVPAVVYGPDVVSAPLLVKKTDFERVFSEAGESSLVRLSVEEGATPLMVLIREVQRDPSRDFPLHIDLHAVRLNEEIKVEVPIKFIGTAPIESRGEGVVVKELHELEVKALPEKLPHEIEVDLSFLDAVDSVILVSSLNLPDGVGLELEGDSVIARASGLISEEELSEIEEGKEDVEGVEVVGEGEKTEEAEENEEGASNEQISEKNEKSE